MSTIPATNHTDWISVQKLKKGGVGWAHTHKKTPLQTPLNHTDECLRNKVPCYNVLMTCYLSLHSLTEPRSTHSTPSMILLPLGIISKLSELNQNYIDFSPLEMLKIFQISTKTHKRSNTSQNILMWSPKKSVVKPWGCYVNPTVKILMIWPL